VNRPLIVGQAPSAKSSPREPLSGTSGRRLATLCGLAHEDFLYHFERVNLIDVYPGKLGKGDRFDRVAARFAACNLTPCLARRRTVLLGGNVARAFHFRHPAFQWVDEIGDGALVAVSPHPSALNKWWNSSWHVERARRFWTALAQEAQPPTLS
jgi:uracil-DNA glycosylase